MKIFSWFSTTPTKIGFEDVQWAITHNNMYIIINTLNENDQDCLIYNSFTAQQESEKINELLTMGIVTNPIIIYGKNSNDESINAKYKQLSSFGFTNLYIYPGGMFEWLLLQDVYGFTEFPTTKHVLDILKYKHVKTFNVARIQY
jgi:hypothetical protein